MIHSLKNTKRISHVTDTFVSFHYKGQLSFNHKGTLLLTE